MDSDDVAYQRRRDGCMSGTGQNAFTLPTSVTAISGRQPGAAAKYYTGEGSLSLRIGTKRGRAARQANARRREDSILFEPSAALNLT